MIRKIVLAATLAGPLAAETDFRALSPEERAVLRSEIRAVLLSHPEIIDRAMNPSPYASEISKDLSTIAAFEKTLFDGADFALVVGSPCESCARAAEELKALSAKFGLSFKTLKIEAHPELAKALELDQPPFYILPETVLRGHLPPIVLEPYLKRLSQD